jgi:hypothetical protein
MMFNSEKFLLGVKFDDEYYNLVLNIIKKRNLWDCLLQIFLVRRDKTTLEMLLICLLSKQMMLKPEIKDLLRKEIHLGEISFGKEYNVSLANSSDSEDVEVKKVKFTLTDPMN